MREAPASYTGQAMPTRSADGTISPGVFCSDAIDTHWQLPRGLRRSSLQRQASSGAGEIIDDRLHGELPVSFTRDISAFTCCPSGRSSGIRTNWPRTIIPFSSRVRARINTCPAALRRVAKRTPFPEALQPFHCCGSARCWSASPDRCPDNHAVKAGNIDNIRFDRIAPMLH